MWAFIGRLLLGVALSVIAAALSFRKPPRLDSQKDELGIPRADEGTEIPKVFGTVTIKSPFVAWYGHKRARAIVQRGPRRFGLFGPRSSTTIGYRYDLGIHFVPCLGPIDALLRITYDTRIAWLGRAFEGNFEICKPTLFGARDREGGIRGRFDVLSGRINQGRNGYLLARHGDPQPAYRGVMSVIFRRMYIGNAPTVRPIAMRVLRINNVSEGYNGGVQWYPERAPIFQRIVNPRGERQMIYIALDVSGSMIGTRLTTMKAAVTGYLADLRTRTASQRLVDLRIVPYSSAAGTAFQRLRCRGSDFNAAISFVNGLSATGATNFGAAVASAPAFFEEGECRLRRLLFVTDGAPTSGLEAAVATVQSLNNVAVHAFNIASSDISATSQIDNTPEDGVPVVSGSDAIAFQTALAQSFAEFDMNPVHILRELVLSPDTGGTGDNASVGSTWTAAADVLFNENFGLSDVWNTPANRQEFKQRIERHVDCRVYQDRRTGLWEIRLIRDDYDPNTLPVFDQSNVSLWEQVNFPEAFNLPNQLTVVYNDPRRDEKASVTITDPARVLAVGRIIPEKQDYSAVHRAGLASRIAQRDLAALSAPLVSGVFLTPNLPVNLNLGSPIKIHNPRLGINNRIVRIQEIEDGDGRQNVVRVRFLEDRFSLGSVAFVEDQEFPEEPEFPQTPDPRVVEEATYWALATGLGQDQVDAALVTDPEVGLPFVAYSEVAGASSGIVTVEVSGTYEEQEEIGLVPPLFLASPLGPYGDHTRVTVYAGAEPEFEVGTLAHIGEEIVRIEGITVGIDSTPGDYWHPVIDAPTGDELYVLDLGRGVADTSPDWHAIRSAVMPWIEGSAVVVEETFTSGDTARVKFLTISLGGVLDEDVAEEDEILMAARALRPYPPGDLRITGSYRPGILALSDAGVTWEHRDRIAQGSTILLDHEEAGIGPEYGTSYIGTSYEIRMKPDFFSSADLFAEKDWFLDIDDPIPFRTEFNTADDNVLINTQDADFFEPTDFFDQVDVFEGSFLPSTMQIALGVSSMRDGYSSWTEPKVYYTPLLPPFDLEIEGEAEDGPEPPSLEFDEAEVNLMRTSAVLRVPGQSVNLIRVCAVLRIP